MRWRGGCSGADTIIGMWSRRGLIAGLAAAPFGQAVAQFRIEISGIGATQWPIAVPAWKGEAGAPSIPSDIVRSDLERSGAFRLIEAAGAFDETTALPQEQLRRVGADALLAASLEIERTDPNPEEY